MESDRSPSRSTVTNRNGGNAFTEYSTLTVRDYFASKAMVVYLERISKAIDSVESVEERINLYKGIAPCAYEMADAMLREREKQK